MSSFFRQSLTRIFQKEGFSLLEIVIALALFGSVLLAFLEYFSQAYRFERENQQSFRALLIAQSIAAILKTSAPEGALAIGPTWSNNAKDVLSFSLEEPSLHCVAYDERAQPQRAITSEEYNNALREEKITSLARVTIEPAEPIPGLAQVRVTIATPASAPEKKRRHVEFCFHLSTLPRYENATK